jgi:hypothetical protein
MAARILKLHSARQVVAAGRVASRATIDLHQRFLFWHGASGGRYVHTVYGLAECPELGPANYILVRSLADGRRKALRIGRVTHEAPALNLAEIRRFGAELGADEVHVHLLARDATEAKVIEFDLLAGQLETSPRQRASPTLH